MRSLVLIACVALAACQPDQPPVGQLPNPVAETITLEATDALRLATDGYAAAATAASVAVKAGFGNRDQLLMLRTLNNQAYKLLNNADSGLTVAQKAASLALVVKQINSIIGRK